MDTVDPSRAAFGDALRECVDSKFCGVLWVEGWPGGAIYLEDGRVVACHTPGAPSLEVILLRSGRISEPDWNAAFTAAAVSDNQMTAELTGRGLVGAGELEALLRITVADAVFALVSGRIASWRTEPSGESYSLLLSPGANAGWLLAEATRRTKALAAFPGPALSALDRVALTSATARRGQPLGQGRDEILALADGRRTARDLAFALGGGLYPTMLQLTRMRADGLVVTSPPGEASQPPDRLEAGPATADGDGTTTGLPRRRKDRSGLPLPGGLSRRNVAGSLQILRPRSERGNKPD
jgi:Domain of unknown function (DUF4388)